MCVTTLGRTLEIQEPPCHIWVSPCRSCARLCWMALELVVALRDPLAMEAAVTGVCWDQLGVGKGRMS